MYTLESNSIPTLMSEADQEKVREQMNRMLETHHFKNSRRYPPLLRFIVEETLEGRGDQLKERLLGINVFNRPADYDTAIDPIVRVTVAEIRKRIAQYYHDEEHDAEIRIELMPGRYAPEFRRHRESSQEKPQATSFFEPEPFPATVSPSTTPAPNPTAVRAVKKKAWVYAWGTAAALALGVAGFFLLRWMYPPALDELWAPILSSSQTVLFCLPTDVGKKSGYGEEIPTELRAPSRPAPIPGDKAEKNSTLSFLGFESLGENIVYSDMLATLSAANFLAVHHHEYHVKLNISTTLDDMRDGPDILIGGLDNQWTMRALGPLRYHFAGSDEDRYWIADAQHPNDKRWSLDLKQNYTAINRDYAIIARLHNEQTGQPELIIAGIGMSGTAAAGEFLSNEKRTEELRARIGKGFKSRDFEVVLGTDVVNGVAGSPKILAISVL